MENGRNPQCSSYNYQRNGELHTAIHLCAMAGYRGERAPKSVASNASAIDGRRENIAHRPTLDRKDKTRADS